jgi:hypothetical protein
MRSTVLCVVLTLVSYAVAQSVPAQKPDMSASETASYQNAAMRWTRNIFQQLVPCASLM